MDKDLFIATTQRNLSFLIVGGYFALLVLRGLGWIGGDVVDLNELLMLVATFWFLRARPNGAPPNSNHAPKGGTDETSRTEP